METNAYQKQIIEEVKVFADSELRPFVREFEEQEVIPRTVIEKMAKKGYLASSFPKKYGGLALDPVYYGLFTEEIGKACSSVRALLTVHTSLVGETILRWGSQEQKEKWLPRMAKGVTIAAFCLTEPDVGTDARSVQTSYRKEGKSYIINGKKKWITLGDIADLFLVVCSQNGKITAFLIERAFDGIKTLPIKGLLAGRSEHIAEVEFNNVEVPEENILGKEGNGFAYIVNTALDHGRYSVAWAGTAIAQEALNAMVTYSRQRNQFGQKIYNHQLIQGIIGDATTNLYAGRAVCLRAGELRKEKAEAAIIETTIAKHFTSKMAMKVTTDAVQVHGGNGCCNQYPVERLFREAKILEIIEGTTQVLQDVIAKFSLRRHYNRTMSYSST